MKHELWAIDAIQNTFINEPSKFTICTRTSCHLVKDIIFQFTDDDFEEGMAKADKIVKAHNEAVIYQHELVDALRKMMSSLEFDSQEQFDAFDNTTKLLEPCSKTS